MKRIHWPGCNPMTCTLNHAHTETEMVNLRGWKVGDVLEGDEGHGPTRVRITAIGLKTILGMDVDRKDAWELSWTLTCRCWRKVGGDATAPFELGQRVMRPVYRSDARPCGEVVGFTAKGWPVVRWDGTKGRHPISPDVLTRWAEQGRLLSR